MRASRLVSLLLLLQTRERMTARELAAALEVSVRTIYRDVESLGAAGVPVYGEPGHDGGYRLVGGYHTRLTGLTVDEAGSLFLTGLPAAAAELGMGAVTTAVQLKLLAALPAHQRDRAERIAGRFHLDAPAWYRDTDRTPHLGAVAEAVWGSRAVVMRYRRWAEPREVIRTAHPYGLVLKAGHWYLVADTGGRLRTYRIARITELTVLDEHFERPADFDLAAHWRDYLDTFDTRRRRHRAILRLSPEIIERLPHLWDSAMAEAVAVTATAPDRDGWIRVRVPIESLEQGTAEILRLGVHTEVLGPGELREHLARTLDTLHRRYRPDTASAAPERVPEARTGSVVGE